ncbi:recombinase family protein [Desulfolithobacter sp.]
MKNNTKKPRCYSYLRFSSLEQGKGHSAKRQLELSRKYAREHGLILDESLEMEDRGLSAYHGDHVKEGALGQFLRLVEQGKIPPGSVLLVENLDRLSRQRIVEAQTQFLAIIRAGITIVTLQDKQTYSLDTINENFGSLIVSLAIMARAHEESKAKSERVRAAWENKRQQAQVKPITSRIPKWLRLNKKTGEIEEIPERSLLIKQIFQWSIEGLGAEAIAKRLNTQKVPTWGKSNGWRKSYIAKILNSRAVIGEFQPMTRNTEGKRVPAGEPIKNYFPAVIEEEYFIKTQHILKKRQLGAGRVGKITNLFTHLIKCGYCGSSVIHVNKGRPPKGGEYLVCDSARRGLGCKYVSMQYRKFEESFLNFVLEVDINTILARNSENRELQDAQSRFYLAQQQLDEVSIKIENSLKLISSLQEQEAIDNLARMLDELHRKKSHLEGVMRDTESEIFSLSSGNDDMKSHVETIRKLQEAMATDNEERVDLRRKLKQSISNVVDRIIAFPDGLRDKILKFDGISFSIEEYCPFPESVELTRAQIEEPEKYAEKYISMLNAISEYTDRNSGKEAACFFVWLKSGYFRGFYWDSDRKEFVQDIARTDRLLKLGKLEFNAEGQANNNTERFGE